MNPALVSELGRIIGVILGVIGFFVSLRQFKLSKTMEYMQHLSDPAMIDTRCAVDNWLDSSDEDYERLQKIEHNTELHNKVKVFLSFCNQVSIAYRFGAIHKQMAFEVWNPFIPKYWDKLEFYIKWRRAQGDIAGQNFQKFARDIDKFQRRKRNKRSY